VFVVNFSDELLFYDISAKRVVISTLINCLTDYICKNGISVGDGPIKMGIIDILLVTGFVTRLTRRVPLVEQKMLTLPKHLSLLPIFSGVRVTLSLVFCVVFRWLPLWYLQSNISFQYQYQHIFIYSILLTYGLQETAALIFPSVFLFYLMHLISQRNTTQKTKDWVTQCELH
jgi:hypothetical protein